MIASIRIHLSVSLRRTLVLAFIAPGVAVVAQQPVPFAARMYDTAGTVRRVIAADLDVDGDLDLVNTLDNSLQVRWNQGGGVLAAPSTVNVGATCEDVC